MLPTDLLVDEEFLMLSAEEFKTAVGLRMHCDDAGRQTANPAMILSQVWPLTPSMTVETIEDHLLRLDELGYLALYTVEGRTFYAMTDWPAVSHPAPSRLPPPPPGTFQRAAGAPPAGFSAGGREREWAEGGGERGGEESPAGGRPSSFCRLHQPAGTRSNCRHCGTARLAAEQWEREMRREAEDEHFDGPPDAFPGQVHDVGDVGPRFR